MNIFVDSKMTDSARRQAIYEGAIFVYSASPSSLSLCEFAREMIVEAFGGLDPQTVQESMPAEHCAEILAALKPAFIHHANSKQHIQRMLTEFGCDLEKTYFDVPRMRTAFPGDYLKAGIAYAFHPHRDTWYSAPACQINWWIPIFDISPDNAMAFHPRYWNTAVPNSSNTYNYYEWNRTNRQNAAQHIKADTRLQPRPTVEVDLDPQVRVVPNVGGPLLFSAAHLHSTVPNTTKFTRFSIDFRTVHLDDVWQRCGAPNIDAACTGTTMRDYLRGVDFNPLPEEAVALYFDGTEAAFTPSPTRTAAGVALAQGRGRC
jgi:hypothetical protein